MRNSLYSMGEGGAERTHAQRRWYTDRTGDGWLAWGRGRLDLTVYVLLRRCQGCCCCPSCASCWGGGGGWAMTRPCSQPPVKVSTFLVHLRASLSTHPSHRAPERVPHLGGVLDRERTARRAGRMSGLPRSGTATTTTTSISPVGGRGRRRACCCWSRRRPGWARGTSATTEGEEGMRATVTSWRGN